MKKILSILVVFATVLVFTLETRAQTLIEENVFAKFVYYYNNNQSDSLFNLFSEQMQRALPFDKTKQFVTDTKKQCGKIVEYNFLKYHRKSKQTIIFKTRFTNNLFNVNIVINKQGKIGGLLLELYKKELAKNISNLLQGINEELSDMIYNKVKVFPNNTQISFALIQNGKSHFYGVIVENDTLKYIENKNKVFAVGSITKVFIANVLADMVIHNKIKLTDKINKYYSFDFKNNIKLCFMNLSNHTSGLPRLPSNLDLSQVDPANPYKNYNKDKLNEYLRKYLKLLSKEGEKYQYSNIGTGILGYTLGLIEGKNIEELLRENVLDKYEMNNSYTNRTTLKNKLVKGLNSEGIKVENWDFNVLFGAGGILSCTNDLSKYLTAQFNSSNKELILMREPTFTVNSQMKMGLGWHIIKMDMGKEVCWHNGGTGGYSSSMALDTESKSGVVILSNVSSMNSNRSNIDALCFELIRYIENDKSIIIKD